MIRCMALKLYKLNSTNPYVNLAFEDYLFRKHQKSNSTDQILILWKSEPSVVMGKFQNPWLECQVKKIRSLGINLVRRQSGGGCVYHDHGNLNYSFISPKENYDKSRNASIIVEALKALGVNAFENQRHDLRIMHEGVDYKISGCAFKETRQSALHHGTLLIKANIEQLNELLRSGLFLENAMGVKSVRSSVINLETVSSGISEEAIKAQVLTSFSHHFASEVQVVEISEQEICMLPELMPKIEYNKSWKWVYGTTPKFTFAVDSFVVTAKYARVIAIEPECEDLMGLIIDKEACQDTHLTSIQSEFVNNCYDILFV